MLGDWKPRRDTAGPVLDKVWRTSMLLLPLLDPVDAAAEKHRDARSHSRTGAWDVGVATATGRGEEAAGAHRKDRVPKLEESLRP